MECDQEMDNFGANITEGCRQLLSYGVEADLMERQNYRTTLLYRQRIFCQVAGVYLEYYQKAQIGK